MPPDQEQPSRQIPTSSDNVDNGLRPDDNDLDKIHIEARIARDHELTYFESKRLALNARLEISQNIGDSQEIIDALKQEIKNLDNEVELKLASYKERLKNVINELLGNLEEAIQSLGQYGKDSSETITEPEFEMMALMMNKKIIIIGEYLIIPLLLNTNGRNICFIWSRNQIGITSLSNKFQFTS